ncbi:MAG: AAA family ATPase, partial [Firmicutes bacterium]|nr:AAA family ATPase [Bacillota bacterium]
AVCAPTGRAAKRVTETTGHYASTIHRLLEYYYSEDTDEMRFGKTQEDQLEYDAVIVDEASMIDILLMKGLADALKPGTRLILIGDCDQLPPVGAGNVLRDIMESDTVDTIRLTEIFRQAGESMIIVNAHRINSGEYPFLNEKDKDFYFMERRDEESCLALLVELAGKRLPAYIGSSDPLSDIQVLTPTRKGPLGTVALNEVLQKALNPPAADKNEKSIGGRIFREGDKVMQIRNNYQIGWKRRRDLAEGQGIFNGDVGLIRRIDSEYGRVTVVFDDERFVEYEFAQMDELEHAYAVTVHKSQGSEFPVVVMPVMNVPPALATRNLLYTAVTRGKELVVLLGRRDRLFSMVDNNSIRLRYSGLGARLRALAETGI